MGKSFCIIIDKKDDCTEIRHVFPESTRFAEQAAGIRMSVPAATRFRLITTASLLPMAGAAPLAMIMS